MKKPKKEDETILVRIQASERVRYDRTVKMTRAEFEAIRAEDWEDHEPSDSIIDQYLDRNEVLDSDDARIDDAREVKSA